MTGTDIVAALLLADTTLLAAIAEGSIKEDRLPDGIALPAVLLRVVSSVDRQTLKRGATTRTVDRVAATVRARSTRERKALIKLLRSCCAGKTGDLGGATGVSILTAGTGPSVIGPADSFEQTQDFRVSYDAPL